MGLVYSISRNKIQALERGLQMEARDELRRCTVCHEVFGWNENTRCICNECKKMNVAGKSCSNYEKSLFIMVNHNRKNRMSA